MTPIGGYVCRDKPHYRFRADGRRAVLRTERYMGNRLYYRFYDYIMPLRPSDPLEFWFDEAVSR